MAMELKTPVPWYYFAACLLYGATPYLPWLVMSPLSDHFGCTSTLLAVACAGQPTGQLLTNLSIQLGFFILFTVPTALIGFVGGLAINANRRWVRQQLRARAGQPERN